MVHVDPDPTPEELLEDEPLPCSECGTARSCDTCEELERVLDQAIWAGRKIPLDLPF